MFLCIYVYAIIIINILSAQYFNFNLELISLFEVSYKK